MARLLTPSDALSVIKRAFVNPPVSPPRLAAQSDDGPGQSRTLLTMPALRPAGLATIKLVTVLQGARAGLSSHLIALDYAGKLLAVIEAHHLTALRTAAASVLAAQELGASTVRHLAVLGAGRQARAQIDAFAAAMPLGTITIWARRIEAAKELAEYSRRTNCDIRVALTVGEAVADAELVTAATACSSAILPGQALTPGTHVDLVGGFRPTMREADDALVARAAIVADTPAALVEAGDLTQPIANGVIRSSDVLLMSDLLAGKRPRPGDVTMFKSVGHAAEDLVVAELLLERLGLLDVTGSAQAN